MARRPQQQPLLLLLVLMLLSAPLATQAFHPPLPQRATAAAAQRGWTSPRARARPQQQSQPLQMVLDPVSVLGDVSRCVGVELWDVWMRVCVCTSSRPATLLTPKAAALG